MDHVVFITYASVDQSTAEAVCCALEAAEIAAVQQAMRDAAQRVRGTWVAA